MKHAKNVQSPVQLSARRKLYLAVAAQLMLASQAYAGPTGGEVVGGQGSISQVGKETTIIQDTDHLSIDWQTFNIDADERVEFIQPGADSVALNRILGHDASNIFGQLDANGTVVLVNPNGVFFGEGASVNVGGLVASGLMVNPEDFMNGDFAFEAIEGSDGAVVNSGLINASVGGSVVLMGKQVENKGLITAKLGKVSLAAGKEAVLSFDNQGLIGVRVSKEILQNEIGMDEAAVSNSGDIDAEGGKILLTASVSQDVFTQAVNAGEFDSKASVVMHEDGSFTLGGGSNVVNTGSLSVASDTENAGDVVMLGENVTHEGNIFAESNGAGSAGHVEVHAKDTAVVAGQGSITVEATQQGKGGDVKVLGDRVGLFDDASINASGVNGGGDVLIGGDFQGKNDQIKNATQTVVGANTSITADAGTAGDGGSVILWADDTTVYKGDISVTGGSEAGDGGFVEVSGKENLSYRGYADTRAVKGESGSLLLDPTTIIIVQDATASDDDEIADGFTDAEETGTFTISVDAIEQALQNGDVTLAAGIDIGSNEPGGLLLQSNSQNDLTLESGFGIYFQNDDVIDIAGDLYFDSEVFNFSDGVEFRASNITLRRNPGLGQIALNYIGVEHFLPQNNLTFIAEQAVTLNDIVVVNVPHLILQAPQVGLLDGADLTVTGDLTWNLLDQPSQPGLNIVGIRNVDVDGNFSVAAQAQIDLGELDLEAGNILFNSVRGVDSRNAQIYSRGDVTFETSEISSVRLGRVDADGVIDLSGPNQIASFSSNVRSEGLLVGADGVTFDAGIAVDAGAGDIQISSGPGTTRLYGNLSGNNITLSGYNLDLPGSINANGNVVLSAAGGELSVALGDVSADRLNIDGWGDIIFEGNIDVGTDLFVDTTQGVGNISINESIDDSNLVTLSAGNKIELLSGGGFNLNVFGSLNAGAGGVLVRAAENVSMGASQESDTKISTSGDVDIQAGNGNFWYWGTYSADNLYFSSLNSSLDTSGEAVINVDGLVDFDFSQGDITYVSGVHTISASSFNAAAQTIVIPDIVLNIDSSNSSNFDGDVTFTATGIDSSNRSISLPTINQISSENGSQLQINSNASGAAVGASIAAASINFAGEVVFDVNGELNFENVELDTGSLDVTADSVLFGSNLISVTNELSIAAQELTAIDSFFDVSSGVVNAELENRVTISGNTTFDSPLTNISSPYITFLGSTGTTQIVSTGDLNLSGLGPAPSEVLFNSNVNINGTLDAVVNRFELGAYTLKAGSTGLYISDSGVLLGTDSVLDSGDVEIVTGQSNIMLHDVISTGDVELNAGRTVDILGNVSAANLFGYGGSRFVISASSLIDVGSGSINIEGGTGATPDISTIAGQLNAREMLFNFGNSLRVWNASLNATDAISLTTEDMFFIQDIPQGGLLRPINFDAPSIELDISGASTLGDNYSDVNQKATFDGGSLVINASNSDIYFEGIDLNLDSLSMTLNDAYLGEGQINVATSIGITSNSVFADGAVIESVSDRLDIDADNIDFQSNSNINIPGDISITSLNDLAFSGEITTSKNLLLESTAGNVSLGIINVSGLLEVYSASGEVSQTAGTRISSSGTALFDTNGNKLTLTASNNDFDRIGFNNVLSPEIVDSNVIRWVGHNQSGNVIDGAVREGVAINAGVIEIEQALDYSNFTASSGNFTVDLTSDSAINLRDNIYLSTSGPNNVGLELNLSATDSNSPIFANILGSLYLSGGHLQIDNAEVTFDPADSLEVKTNFANANTRLGDNLGGVYLNNTVEALVLPTIETGTLEISATGNVTQAGGITAGDAILSVSNLGQIVLSYQVNQDTEQYDFENDFDNLWLDVEGTYARIKDKDDIVIESIVSRYSDATLGAATVDIDARDAQGEVLIPSGSNVIIDGPGRNLNIYTPKLIIDGEVVLNGSTLNVNAQSFNMSGRIASDVSAPVRINILGLGSGLSSVDIESTALFENISWAGVDSPTTSSYINLNGTDAVANISADIPFMLQSFATNSTVFNINANGLTIEYIRGSDGRDTIAGEISSVDLTDLSVDGNSFDGIEYFDKSGISVYGADVATDWTLGINNLDRVEFVDQGGNDLLLEFNEIGVLNGGSGDDTITIAGQRSIDTYLLGFVGDDTLVMGASASQGLDNLLFEYNGMHELHFGNIDDLLNSELDRYTYRDNLVDGANYFIAEVENFVGGNARDAYFTYTNDFSTGIDFDGGAGSDFLFAWFYPDDPAALTQWNVTGAYSGNIDNAKTFSNVENIGGDFTQVSQDIFNLSANAVLNNIYGGDGDDQIIFSQGAEVSSVIGGAGNDAVTSNANSAQWTIDGINSGSIQLGGGQFVSALSGVEEFIGSTGADIFTLTATGQIAGDIYGHVEGETPLADDQLIDGTSEARTWQFNPQEGGIVSTDSNPGSSLGFHGFAEVQAGDGNDTIQLGSSFSGDIRGGAGNDTFVQQGADFIAPIFGGADSDTLIRYDQADGAWQINGDDSGTVTTNGSANTLAFSEFENLLGAEEFSDVFTFSSTALSTLNINAGSGAGIDVVDYSSIASDINVQLTLAGGFSGVTNAEVIQGNFDNGFNAALILSDDVNSRWDIPGNGGENTVSYSGNNVAFRGFNNLQGAGGNDHFILDGNVAFKGSISGNDGRDIFEIAASPNNWRITEQGGGSLDVVGIGDNEDVVFDTIETIIGCDREDIFSIETTEIAGMRFEGGGREDTIINATGVNMQFAVSGQGSATSGSFTVDGNQATFIEMEVVDGSTQTINDLDGADQNATWTLNDGGDYSYAIDGGSATLTFRNISHLDGGAQDDVFIVEDPNAYVRIRGGGNGANGDRIIAYEANASRENIWRISGANSGSLGELNSVPEFVTRVNYFDIEHLQGNDAVDTFTFSADAQIGNIDARGGVDIVNIADGIQAGILSAGADGGVINELTSTIVKNIKNEQVDVLNNSASYSLNETEVTPFDVNYGAGSSTYVVGLDDYDAQWNLDSNGQLSVTILNDRANDGTDDTGSTFTFQEVISSLEGRSGDDQFILGSAATLANTVSGGAGNDTLQISSSGDNTWNINSQAGGDVIIGSDASTAIFDGIEQLIGGDQADTFNFLVGNSVVAVDGGAGSDTIVAFDQANNWVVNGIHFGTLNTQNYKEIENLIGGNQQDTFTFASADIGALSIDAGAVNEGNQLITSHSSDVLWDVDASGVVTYQEQVVVDGIASITAGDGSDRFNIDSAGVNLTLDAGLGAEDVVSFSESTESIVVDLANSTLLTNVEKVIANGAGSVLIGPNQANFWDITGVQTGQLEDGVSFEAFETVQGGTVGDTFYVLDSAAQINIVGVAASNTLQSDVVDSVNYWDLTGSGSGTLNSDVSFTGISSLVGSEGLDKFTDSAAAVFDTVFGRGEFDSFDLSYGSKITIVDAGQGADELILTNGSEIEELYLGAGDDTVSLGNAVVVNSVYGEAGSDRVTLLDGSSVSLIDGGTDNIDDAADGIVDFLDLAQLTQAEELNLQTGESSLGFDEVGFEDKTAAGEGSSLFSGDGDFTWTFFGDNSFTVSGTNGGATYESTSNGTYSSVRAGEGTHTFVFEDGATFDGSIVAAAGGNNSLTGNDILDQWLFDAYNSGQVSGGGTTTTFANIARIFGGSANDTFTVAEAGSILTIDGGAGQNALIVQSAAGVRNSWTLGDVNSLYEQGTERVGQFAGINSIQSTGSDDSFTVTGPIAFDTIDAVGGSNAIFWNAGDLTVNLGDSTLNGSVAVSGIYEYNANGVNATLIGTDAGSTWTLVDGSSGSVDDGANPVVTFSGFNAIEGSASNQDVIVGPGLDSDWTLSGVDQGQLLTITDNEVMSFANIARVEAGSATDRLILAADAYLSAGFDGGAGTDSILGATDQSNSFIVGGAFEGTVADQSFTFTSVENLQAGNMGDGFLLLADAQINNIIGGDGQDQFEITEGASFASVEGGADADLMIVSGGDNAWQLDATGGTLNGQRFDSVEVLVGGDGADQFVLTEASVNATDVDGGDGADSLTGADSDNVWSLAAGTLNDSLSFLNIEQLNGGSAVDTLQGQNLANDWVIDGVSGSVGAFNFSDMNIIVGGTASDVVALQGATELLEVRTGEGDDQVSLASGAQFTGAIYGGAGDDYLDLSNFEGGREYSVDIDSYVDSFSQYEFESVDDSEGNIFFGGENDVRWVFIDDTSFYVEVLDASGAVVKTVNSNTVGEFSQVRSGSGTNTFELAADAVFDGQISASAQGENTLVGTDLINQWLITGANSGSVQVEGAADQTLLFSNIARLIGGSEADSFTIEEGGSLAYIDAGEGADTLRINTLSAQQWQLNSSVGGTLNTSDAVRLFGGVETIHGTDQGDLFVLTANDSDVLNIVAGAGSDTLDFGSLGASVDLETATANGYQVSGVDSYIATSGGLNGADADNNWQLSEGGSQVQWTNSSGDSQTVSFDGFNVLQGGEANDTFVVDGRWSQTAPLIVSANGGEDSITVNTGAQNTLWYYSSGGIVQTFLDDDGTFTQGLTDLYDRTGLQNQLSQADMQFNGFESHVGGDGADIFYAYSDDTSVSFDGAGGVDTLVGHQWVSNPDVQVWNLTGNSLNSGAQGNINSVVSFEGIEVFASDSVQTSNNQFVISDNVSIDSIVTQDGDDQFIVGADAIVGLIDAGAGADSMQAPDAANNWLLSDANSNLNQVTFTGIESLIGGAFADDYVLQSASATMTISSIDAQGGDDSFTGFDEVNTWLVDAAGHSLNGDIDLANFEVLVGGADVDNFQLSSVVSVTLNGGDGQDQLQAFDQVNNWIFSQAGNSINSEVYFANIEDFVGGAQVDTVVAESGGAFNSFDTAGGNDSLTLLEGALVSGPVSGGAGLDDLDIENYTAGNEFDYDLGGIRDGLVYDAFENITQNADISFYGGAGDTRWVFTGGQAFYIEKLAADGSVIETSQVYSIYKTVRGGEGVNTFVLASDSLFSNGANENGTINGDIDGDNTLVGSDLINQWLVDGANSGSISSGGTQTVFNNIAQLIGGSNSDNFEIAAGGSISGLIDGSTGSDTLVVADDALQNQWTLGAQNVLGGTVAQFQGIEAIVGNAGSDVVNISDLSDVTSIDGASGADQVIWSGSELAVNLGAGTLNSKSFASIESFEADAAEQNQVVGTDADTAWSLTGADQLQASYPAGNGTTSVAFSNFGSVTGGVEQDELTVANGSLSVGFDGGDGEDTIIASDVSNAWQLNANGGDVNGLNFSGVETAVGGASDDTFTMLAASTEVQSVQGAGGSDALQAFDQDNDWMIDSNGTSSVTGLASFEGIENFFGGSAVDTVVVAAGSSFEDLDTGDGDDAVTIYSNATANNIFSGEGRDFVTIYPGLQLSGVVDAGPDQSAEIDVGGVLDLSQYSAPNGAPPTEENIEAIVGFDYENFSVVPPNPNGTFAAGDGNNTWYITGVNQGRVVVEDGPNQGTYNFEDIHTLIGGEGNDTFIFENENALIETSITGGDGGLDTIDYSNQSWVVDWLFSGANEGSASANDQALLFSNIAKVIGSSGNDTFNIADGASISDGVDAGDGFDWAVASNTQNNDWTLSANGTQFNTSISFTGLEAIQGAGTVDTFNVTDADAEVSQIVGGGASDILNILYAQAVTADVAQGLIGQLSIQDIENINASTAGNRIVAANNNNTWSIAADGSVAVSYLVDQSNEQLVFTGFDSLQGGDLQDSFTLAANANFAGSIDGGAGSDSLAQTNGDNTWNVTADDQGQVGQISFTQVERLEGGSGVDQFDIAANAVVSEGVDGGTGNADRITHRADAKDWVLEVVDGKAGGQVAGTQFSAIENLDGAGTQDRILGGSSDNTWAIGDNANNTYVDLANDTTLRIRYQGMEAYMGGDGSDIFNILNLQALPSAIEGGAGVDSLNLQTVNADLNIAMGGSQALPVGGNGIAVNNVENVQANRQQRTVVYGNSDQAYSWLVDGARSAQVTASISDENAQTIYFEDISALVGGDHDDTFSVTTNNTSISIDGGDAQTLDFVDYSQVNANVSINLANGVSAAGTIAGIEGVRGNAAGGASLNSSEIIASDAVNTWTIGDLDGDGRADGINDGSVTSVNGTVFFEDFNIITGGAQADTFELSGGAIRGTIRGGAGNDTLNAEVVGLNAGTVFDGGADVDTMNLSGGGDDFLAVYTPNQNGGEFNYSAANVDYSIGHQNVENLNDNVVAQTLEIRGSAVIETFVINNGNFGINQNTPVSYTNKTNLFVNADQSDAIDIGENLVVEGTLALANGSVVSSDPAGTSITANQLLLDGTRDVGTRNGRIRTNVSELSARNVEGDVYLSEVSELDIVDLDVTGEVDIVVQNGDLIASGVLQSEDDFRVAAVNGNISLLEDNRLEGDIILEAAAGNIDLYNTVDTRLGDITANVLNVETEGSLDLDGPVNVTTNASFVADDDIDGNDAVVVQGTATFESGRDIRVTDSANDFNVLVVNGADNVEFEDQNSLVVGGIAASGEVEILSEGIEVAEQIVADSIYLDAQQGVATLNAILDADPGNDVTVIAQDIIQNADIFAGRDIVLTAVDTIERNATAHADNELRINADNVIVAEGATTEGRQVIISAVNDLEVRSEVTGDSVSIDGGRVIIDGSVTARDGDANVNGGTLVNIGGSVSGNNNVNVATNEGDVEQSGTIAANTGTTTVNAGGAGNINMNGDAQTSGNDVKLDAGNNILLGGVTAKETVEVKANTGDVKDNNGEAANITADRLVSESQLGFGNDDAIETDVSNVNISNGVQDVAFNNVGDKDVVVESIKTQGNVDVEAEKDIELGTGSIVANSQDGSGGKVKIETSQGGIKQSSEGDGPAIVSKEVVLDARNGEIGQGNRLQIDADRIDVNARVKTGQLLVKAGTDVNEYFSGSFKFEDQIVSVEQLEDVNPAVFTNVKSYFHNDISLRLPSDQLYEEDEEDY